VAAKSVKRGAGGVVAAVLFGLTLLMAGCQAGAPGTSAAAVHFTAQSDIGLGAEARQVLDTVAGLRPQLNLALGDLAYEAGIDREFCDMVKGKLGEGFPYEVLTGNQESDGHDGDIENIVRCLPNRLAGLRGDYGTQWYVDVPEKNPLVRFVMVSPGIKFQGGQHLDYAKGSERWDWTTNAIDGASAARIPWTVVSMHAACLSLGKYDCKVGQDFANMLLEKKVDLVLSGDEHIYQRSHQLGLGPACPGLVPNAFAAGCVADSDSSMVKGSGTVFATVGVGGVGLYDVNGSDPEAGYFAASSGKNRDAAFGTLDVTATAGQLSARFVPAKGFSFTDAFTIGQP
jgi:hypothetical protein